MQTLQRLLAAAVVTTASVVAIPTAYAQAQSQAPQRQAPSQPAPSAATPQLSDQKLDAAAAALQRVASLQQEYRQRVASAQAPAEKEALVAEANDALTKAVTEQGLSVEEYASIMDTARDNLEVRGKILKRIRPNEQPPQK